MTETKTGAPSRRAMMRRLVPPRCHWITFGLFAVFAALRTCPSWVSAPETEAGGIEMQLSSAFNLHVAEGSARWVAPPDGGFGTAARLHELVFLAGETSAAPSDLFRVAARTIDGRTLFAAEGLRNLSESPAGCETLPTVSDAYAVSASRTDGGEVPTVAVFDFRGAQDPASLTGFARIRERITRLLETGRPQGVGKTVVRFTSAPKSVDYSIEKGGVLALRWETAAGEADAAEIPLGGPGFEDERFSVLPNVRPVKSAVLWVVDTVRSLDFVGPGPIEWAEGRAFAVKDFIRRTRYRWFGDDTVDDEASEGDAAEAVYAVLDLPAGLEIGEPAAEEVWPPAPFEPPVFSRRVAGEGEWRPTGPEFLRRLDGAPPAFYRSLVRPDRERPYVKVKLFAMDMRQLELHMVGGIEDPQSTTGSVGDGRIPRKKGLMERTVAAFNGAFKTEHGAYGMMVAKNVLLLPKDDAATAAALTDGTALLGTWPAGAPVPADVYSYRQNMDPLVESGVVNPRRRYLWGFTLGNDITQMHTVRSGLCLSDKGYMIYAWGEDVTAKTLGTAMNAAGCVYGIHLDMNPYHTAFMFYRFELEKDEERPKYEYRSAIPETMYSPHRYINGAPKDFFYLALRDGAPGENWRSEGTAQPVPAFIPAVFRKDAAGCRAVAVRQDRVSARIVSGSGDGEDESSTDPDAEPVVPDLLVDLSVDRQAVEDGPGGALPARLAADEDGGLRIVDAGTSVSGDAAGLAGFRFGEAGSGGQVVGVGIREGGWLLLASGAEDAVQKFLVAEGATEMMYLIADEDEAAAAHVFVRDAEGMVDLNGRRVMRADLRLDRLQLSANPRPMGARRLETAFPPTKKNDAGEDKGVDQREK